MPRFRRSSVLAAHLPELKELLRMGILRTEPNASFTRRMKRESVFDGSYDFHSCVIAHLALTHLADASEDGELEAWLAGRLTPEAFARESETLLQRKGRAGTHPYDEGWFLVLLAERARRSGEPAGPLGSLCATHEARLVEWLEENSFPERPASRIRKQPFLCGFYRSWLCCWLLVHWSGPRGEGVPERLDALAAERIDPVRSIIGTAFAPHPYDFLWVPALVALVDRERGVRSAYDLGLVPPWPSEVAIRDVHVVGRELSRAWPCAFDGGAGDGPALATYEAHVGGLLARRDLWAEDFAAVSHWLPQYLFLGWWIERRGSAAEQRR